MKNPKYLKCIQCGEEKGYSFSQTDNKDWQRCPDRKCDGYGKTRKQIKLEKYLKEEKVVIEDRFYEFSREKIMDKIFELQERIDEIEDKEYIKLHLLNIKELRMILKKMK